jgi:ankyrin repeat protein
MKRSQFIMSLGVGAITPSVLSASTRIDPKVPLPGSLVQEFVGTSHRDMERVKSLLAEHPTLLNVAHDWGNGDFETALGAASHVGYMELVTFLVENGAQTNLFTACLFGHLEIVKLIIQAFPSSLNAKGPHGFTPLHHAIRGGDAALPVKEYLESLGAKELKLLLF